MVNTRDWKLLFIGIFQNRYNIPYIKNNRKHLEKGNSLFFLWNPKTEQELAGLSLFSLKLPLNTHYVVWAMARERSFCWVWKEMEAVEWNWLSVFAEHRLPAESIFHSHKWSPCSSVTMERGEAGQPFACVHIAARGCLQMHTVFYETLKTAELLPWQGYILAAWELLLLCFCTRIFNVCRIPAKDECMLCSSDETCWCDKLSPYPRHAV